MNSQGKLENVESITFANQKSTKASEAVSLSNKKKLKKAGLFTLFVGPAFLTFSLIVLIPFFTGVYYAFTDWNGVTGTINWVGLDNFKYLFTEDKQFQTSFWLTLKYTVIDGCTTLGVFWKIVFPLLKPITVTVVILNSLWIWNDFLLPLLVLQDPGLRTIPLATFFFFGQYMKQWDLALAALVISIIPLLIFFFTMQKHIVKGITGGAIK